MAELTGHEHPEENRACCFDQLLVLINDSSKGLGRQLIVKHQTQFLLYFSIILQKGHVLSPVLHPQTFDETA